jgi:hypothetical protein
VCGSVVLPFERTCHLFEFASSICIFLNLHVKRLAHSANLIINQDLKLPFLRIIMLTQQEKRKRIEEMGFGQNLNVATRSHVNYIKAFILD